MFTFIMSVLIIWLLWTIHQDLEESNERQIELKRFLSKLSAQLDKQGSAVATDPVAINSATKNQLRSLPKIGNVVAQRVIDARPFDSIDDLAKVEGISAAMFEELRSKVSL